MVEKVKQTKVGDPFDASTDQGAQVDREQMEKILGFCESGQKEGARLLTGGKRHGDKGFFVEPTVFADVKDDMKIAREEIFGPVMQIMKFNSTEDVIKRANSSEFGLAAGIVTQSVDNAIRLSNALRAGTVWVNCYDIFDNAAPFGGYKDSGIGREKGEAALKNYLETKSVIIARPEDALP